MMETNHLDLPGTEGLLGGRTLDAKTEAKQGHWCEHRTSQRLLKVLFLSF